MKKYVHMSYYVDMYVKAYGLPIDPNNGKEEWKNTGLPILEPPLLMDAISRERPMVNRRLKVDEQPAKHKKRKGAPV